MLMLETSIRSHGAKAMEWDSILSQIYLASRLWN